jgi:prepilin-type N-terminal cleavage/methylation domain-containing protein
MKLRANRGSMRRSLEQGFSLVELALSLAVLLVITTLAVPVVIRSLQSYQLNSAASQLAGLLKFAKFEAIRENTPVNCQVQAQGSSWQVWVDSNGNGVPDGAEPQMFIGGTFTMLPSGSIPDPTPIRTALHGGSSLPWYVISGTNGFVTYDQRGVIFTSAVYVFYLGSASNPNLGYRAVVTLPSGAVQVWTTSSAGNWQRVS